MGELCGELPEKDVADAMRERFGLELSKGVVKGFKQTHGILLGFNGGCFKKGQEPPNKGRSWDEWMPAASQERCRATQFGKGVIRGAAKEKLREVGCESLRRDGQVWVKVDDHQATSAADRMSRWRQRSRVVWEEEHGPLPEGWNVIHADHDPLNDSPENLVAVPRRLISTINNRFHYSDLETLQTAVLMASVLQAATEAKRDLKEGNR